MFVEPTLRVIPVAVGDETELLGPGTLVVADSIGIDPNRPCRIRIAHICASLRPDLEMVGDDNRRQTWIQTAEDTSCVRLWSASYERGRLPHERGQALVPQDVVPALQQTDQSVLERPTRIVTKRIRINNLVIFDRFCPFSAGLIKQSPHNK